MDFAKNNNIKIEDLQIVIFYSMFLEFYDISIFEMHLNIYQFNERNS